MRSHFRLALAVAIALSSGAALVTTGPAGASPPQMANAPLLSSGAVVVNVATDSMTRTTTGGWGNAETGGAYSVTSAAQFSVDGSFGRVILTKSGKSESVTLGSVSAKDVEVRVSIAVKALATKGNGTYSSAIVRAKDGFGYRALLRIATRGIAYLSIGRLNGSAAIIQLTAPVKLPQNASAGGFYNVALSATGDAAVALKAKAWIAGTTEPDWKLNVTDRSSKRVKAAGALTVTSYTSLTSGPAEVWYDNINATVSAGTAPPSPTTPSVSTASNSSAAGALVDGSVATGQTGTEWVAASGDVAPWAQLSFSAAHNVASVQILGPTKNWINPNEPATAPMYGRLVFSDGSSVVVTGIAGGGEGPTTIAFAPRSVSWVRLELVKNDPQVEVGLREFVAYDVGTTPPRWPANTAPRYTAPAMTPTSCAADSSPVGSSPDSSPALVCPAPGTVVNGSATIVVSAQPGSALTATAWLQSANAGTGGVVSVGTAIANAGGRAVFTIDATKLTAGPTAVRVATSSATDRPLYVQVVNAGGVARQAGEFAPSGMTLQWNDDFRTPISVTRNGKGADYAATKPSYNGGGDFGEAVFADPGSNLNTIATANSEYLRIRAQPTGAMGDPNGWGRTHVAGIVSSMKVGGAGFSAQYGYFEARMLAPAGNGSWPAFWMLNSENAGNREFPAAEVDAVELYGHAPQGSCHSLHAWSAPGNSEARCTEPNGLSDWALSWHTYAAWVKPDRIEYYIDDRLVATILGPILVQEPFFFMLNEALGGGWPVNLAGVGNTIDLYVDWIRVYT